MKQKSMLELRAVDEFLNELIEETHAESASIIIHLCDKAISPWVDKLEVLGRKTIVDMITVRIPMELQDSHRDKVNQTLESLAKQAEEIKNLQPEPATEIVEAPAETPVEEPAELEKVEAPKQEPTVAAEVTEAEAREPKQSVVEQIVADFPKTIETMSLAEFDDYVTKITKNMRPKDARAESTKLFIKRSELLSKNNKTEFEENQDARGKNG